MKKNFIKKAGVSITIALSLVLSLTKSNAQCKVSTLDLSTGTYNSTTVPQGNSDPLWYCTNKTGVYVGSSPAVGSSALVVNPNVGWAGGGTWICDNQTHVIPGLVTNVVSNLTFERRFELCNTSDVRFNLNFRSDGKIIDILVDGISQGLSQPFVNFSGGPLWSPTPFTLILAAGSHKLQVVVSNPIPTFQSDPIGFFMNGSINAFAPNIINDQSPQCANYSCTPRCDDKCYWTVDGNNIQSNRNIFGTLTDDDIRIATNLNGAPDRGVIKNGDALTGGYFGWNNTNPTARFHVDCINGNNPNNNIGLPSDIRFENLEIGNGHLLVIDDLGYVYNSKIPLNGSNSTKVQSDNGDILALQQELRELKSQLAEIRNTMAGTTSTNTKDYLSKNKLYQNVPNPSDAETTIKYNIVSMQSSARIIIYDINGKEVHTYNASLGEGTVKLSNNTLIPGTYTYSLIVDGVKIDTKKMVLTK